MSACARSRERCPGYTLVEVVLVLAILGLCAGIAVPRFANSIALHRAEAAGERLVVDLTLARQQARQSSASRTITFDSVAHSYSIAGVAGLDNQQATYSVVLTREPYNARIASVDLGGNNTITFDGYGAPDCGGSIVVSVGRFQVTVTVDAATGKATAN
ncbi:MAG: prepilin-type N-terminal cleavage/methylation domain-containing protein [Phycisphaerae bacterium]|nr:prepilin-type N-terminal cleavage/methylation domain-containing protein [Phycisphaerae bacterium]